VEALPWGPGNPGNLQIVEPPIECEAATTAQRRWKSLERMPRCKLKTSDPISARVFTWCPAQKRLPVTVGKVAEETTTMKRGAGVAQDNNRENLIRCKEPGPAAPDTVVPHVLYGFRWLSLASAEVGSELAERTSKARTARRPHALLRLSSTLSQKSIAHRSEPRLAH